MKMSRIATIRAGLGFLLTIGAIGPAIWGANVAFIVDNGDFNAGTSWSDGNPPTADYDRHFVQDNLTALFASGDTSVHFLTIGDTSLGRLEMSGGTLSVLFTDQFEIGEGIDGEGEVSLTGSAILRAAGAVIGTRSTGRISVGPGAVFDLVEDSFPRDLRIGSFGPAFVPGGPPEPGLDGDGLVDIQGTMNVATVILSQSGARGELRLSGGTANLAGQLRMDLCENCGTDPALVAMRSSKVSVVGSMGTFSVGGNIFAASPTATFSFTADAGGVTPIVAAAGAAEIEMARLELNLDAFAFTPTSRLTLIDAVDLPGLLTGEFGSVTFLGSTTADLHYDLLTSDVYLDNFRRAQGDFNGDGMWNCSDIDALSDEIATMSGNLMFDMNGDGILSLADISDANVGWLAVGGANNPGATGGNPFLSGDANLDGNVDGSDFGVWNANKFSSVTPWCSGNFNADSAVDGSDFGAWNANKFTSSDPAVVPEPSGMGVLGIVLSLLCGRRPIALRFS